MSLLPGEIASGHPVPVELKVYYGKGNSKTFKRDPNELTLTVSEIEQAVRH